MLAACSSASADREEGLRVPGQLRVRHARGAPPARPRRRNAHARAQPGRPRSRAVEPAGDRRRDPRRARGLAPYPRGRRCPSPRSGRSRVQHDGGRGRGKRDHAARRRDVLLLLRRLPPALRIGSESLPGRGEHDVKDVLETLERWTEQGLRVATATVVSTARSAPRDPGAVLAVSEKGEVTGSVPGGCVEPAVYEEAQAVLAGGPPKLCTYGIADDQAFEVGLPCRAW